MKISKSLLVLLAVSAPWAIHAEDYGHYGTEKAAESQEAPTITGKPTPDQVLANLKAGNARYVADEPTHPNSNSARRELGAKEGQGKFAYATVLTCSDSRVPPEHIFDAGLMDLFVIRTAGNPSGSNEIASIEYGLAHVKTPVLVIMGHSSCGAVTAAVQSSVPRKKGDHGHDLEANIKPLIKSLVSPVLEVKKRHPEATGADLVALSVEENVWYSVENLLKRSEVARQMIFQEKVILAPAIYDIATGEVKWLSEAKVFYYLGKLDSKKK